MEIDLLHGGEANYQPFDTSNGESTSSASSIKQQLVQHVQTHKKWWIIGVTSALIILLIIIIAAAAASNSSSSGSGAADTIIPTTSSTGSTTPITPAGDSGVMISPTGVYAGACKNGTVALTEGPYFVDEKINTPNLYLTSQGLLVTMTLQLYNISSPDAINQCVPLPGAMVDMWEADAVGKYSDIASEGTTGQNFLRGYVMADKYGLVTFNTIFPGWYNGRAPHIHLMVRTFDAAGNVNYRDTTQFFFDDALATSVYSLAPYSGRGTRTTLNTNDGIFSNSQLVSVTGSLAAGYSGSFALGVPFSGDSGSNGDRKSVV